MIRKIIIFIKLAPQRAGIILSVIGISGCLLSIFADTFRQGGVSNLTFGPAQERVFLFSLVIFLFGLLITIPTSRVLLARICPPSLWKIGDSDFIRYLDGFLSRLLMFLVGCIIALLIAEVALRLYSPFILRIKGQMIDLPRNIQIDVENPGISSLDSNIIHTKNSLGFRGDDPPINFNDYLTIITVGGSTTECYYLSDGKDWPGQLSTLLKQKAKNVWVNNAGLDGHSTFGHQVLMRDYIVKFRPDIVIFLVGLNDMAYNLPRSYEEWIIESSKGLEKKEESITPTLKDEELPFPCFSSFRCFIKSASPYSILANTIWNLMRSREAYRVDLGHQALDLKNRAALEIDDKHIRIILEKYKTDFLPYYRERILSLIQISRDNGIEPVFITQPALFGFGVDDQTGVNLETVSVTGDGNGKLQWAILELYNDIVREEGKNNQVLVIDLARLMPKSSLYYYDFYHFNNRGAQVVGKIVYENLLPFLIDKGMVK